MPTQVPRDMFAGSGWKLGRAAVAGALAVALATPTTALASEPEGPEPSTAETSETLNGQAMQHVSKALTDFKNGAYVDAEEEFRRVAFYAPNWRPLHFNLAVLAEAQGKLGTAVHEYREFRPHGSSDEQLVVDQRIDELVRRRDKIAGAYRRQIGLSAVGLTLGLGTIGGAAAAFAVYFKRKNEYDDVVAANKLLPYDSPLRQEEEKPNAGLLAAGFYVALIGLAIVGASVIPIRKAAQSKKQLEGIAIGPTRLKWNGGAGVQLRF